MNANANTFAKTKPTSLYFTAIALEPVNPGGTFFSTSRARVASSTGTDQVTIITIEVEGNSPDAYEAAAELIASDPQGRRWPYLREHGYREVADLYVKLTINDLRGVRMYKIGEEVTEWHGSGLRGPAIMTRRDDVKPGDVMFSSFGYYFTVGKVSARALTATITPENKGLHSETFDRHLLVPVMILIDPRQVEMPRPGHVRRTRLRT